MFQMLIGNNGWLLVAAPAASFILFVLFAPFFIRFSKKHWAPQAREDTPATHRAKDYTPTMGGVLMMGTTMLVLLFLGVATVALFSLMLIMFGFCAIGAWDDWNKIQYKKGISEWRKFIGQVIVASIGIKLWWYFANPSTMLYFPIFTGLSFNLGPILFIFWCVWVIACTVNAVNFTDGLDGLATLTLLPNFVLFGLIALWLGQTDVALVAFTVIGSLLGFLWFNCYPAQIFMGDAGSLALGATLASIALMTKYELLIPLAGGMFVLEGVSVAVQKLYFKATRKRIFKMAPFHHHLELSGWPETKITMRFFIVTLFLCVLALGIFLAHY